MLRLFYPSSHWYHSSLNSDDLKELIKKKVGDDVKECDYFHVGYIQGPDDMDLVIRWYGSSWYLASNVYTQQQTSVMVWWDGSIIHHNHWDRTASIERLKNWYNWIVYKNILFVSINTPLHKLYIMNTFGSGRSYSWTSIVPLKASWNFILLSVYASLSSNSFCHIHSSIQIMISGTDFTHKLCP